MEDQMLRRTAKLCSALLFIACAVSASPSVAASADTENGVARVRSAYSMQDTIARIKQDVEAKGIKFFTEIDQTKLARDAGIDLRPSTLLIFGNPPLGAQFLTSNPDAGLDWPVRLLVRQDESGTVWAVYTDFAWIAHRFGVKDREAQFQMASMVIASITSSVAAK
jgi:uncharacterized protein (DUF302 family)